MASRPLTEKEIALAKTVFGDALDYEGIRVHDCKYIFFQSRHSAMAPNGHLYMHKLYSDDYGAENAYAQGLFIHEMTHVWQHQNKVFKPFRAGAKLMLKHKFNYTAAYPYRLAEGKDLTDYNMEQQASIVQDYFLLKHQGRFRWKGKCKNPEPNPDKISLYERVLGKFLENPGYVRDRSFSPPEKRRKPG